MWQEFGLTQVALITALAILFLLTLIGMHRSASSLRAYRRELIERALGLRIHRMLGRLGISLPRYLRRASPWDVERHLMRCEHCPTTQDCDLYLDEGARLDERGFCPNFNELEKLKAWHRANR